MKGGMSAPVVEHMEQPQLRAADDVLAAQRAEGLRLLRNVLVEGADFGVEHRASPLAVLESVALVAPRDRRCVPGGSPLLGAQVHG